MYYITVPTPNLETFVSNTLNIETPFEKSNHSLGYRLISSISYYQNYINIKNELIMSWDGFLIVRNALILT